MSLLGKSTVFSSRGKTKYMTIPSAIAQDSTFPFSSSNEVTVYLIPDKGLLVVRRGEELSIEETNEGSLRISHTGYRP